MPLLPTRSLSVLLIVLVGLCSLQESKAQSSLSLEDIFPGRCSFLLYQYATQVPCMDSFAELMSLFGGYPTATPATICQGPCLAQVNEVLSCSSEYYDTMDDNLVSRLETFRRLLCVQDSANRYCLLHTNKLTAVSNGAFPTTTNEFDQVCNECYYKIYNVMSQVNGVHTNPSLFDQVQNLATLCTKVFIPGPKYCLEIFPPSSSGMDFMFILQNLENICMTSCLNKIYATQLLNNTLSAYEVAEKETVMSTLCMKNYPKSTYCARDYSNLFVPGGYLDGCGQNKGMGCYDATCNNMLNLWYNSIGCCFYPMATFFGQANSTLNFYQLLGTCSFMPTLLKVPGCSIYNSTSLVYSGLTSNVDVPYEYASTSFGREYFMRDIALNFGILPSQVVIKGISRTTNTPTSTTFQYEIQARDQTQMTDILLQVSGLYSANKIVFPRTYSNYNPAATKSDDSAAASLTHSLALILSLAILVFSSMF